MNIPETFFPARVLLVDDEHHQLQLRACFLRMAGFPVLTAQGPLDALSLVRTIGELDVAIVDYEMPVMNGGVLAQHLKRKFPKLNVVLYSAAVLVPFCDLNSIDAFIPKGEGITVLLHHMWNLSAEVNGTRCHAEGTEYDNPESPPPIGLAEPTFFPGPTFRNKRQLTIFQATERII